MASKENVELECTICGKEFSVAVPGDELMLYDMGVDAQKSLKSLTVFEREALISHMCFECQERTFNIPLPEHEAEWGEKLGECECCGARIYRNKNKLDGKDIWKCPSCGVNYNYHEDTKELEGIW